MISIDGNVYTGKTTLARALATRMGRKYIPEHSEFVRPHGEGWELHQAYIAAEAARDAREGAVLDRSVLSLAAHTWAMYREGVDVRARFLEAIGYEQARGHVAVPRRCIVLTCPYGEILDRAVRGEMGPDRKMTSPALLTYPYMHAVDEFLGAVAERTPVLRLHAMTPREAIDAAARWVEIADIMPVIREVLR